MKKLFHLYPRGVRRGNLFETPRQHRLFRRLVCKYAKELGVEVILLVTMTNHYHIIIECEPSLKSRFMKRVNWAYSRSYNETHELSGHAFERTCKGREIRGDGDLAHTARYAFLNPVVAGITAAPGDYLHSTYRATIGEETLPDGIRAERLLQCFSSEWPEAQRALKAYVERLTPDHPIVRDALRRLPANHPKSAKARNCRWVLEFAALTAAAVAMEGKGRPFNGLLDLTILDLQLLSMKQRAGASGSMIASIVGMPKSSVNKMLARLKQVMKLDPSEQKKLDAYLDSLIFPKSRAVSV